MDIFKTNYWEVELSEDQAYLARCFIILKRKCGDLAKLKEEEIVDFLNVVKRTELAIKKSFGAEMFNWSCLMNNAYKSKNPQPQIHWDCRPRYKSPVKFSGIIFEDKEFAHHYNKERHFQPKEEMVNKIVNKIRESLK